MRARLDWDVLQQSIAGEVILADAPGYETARKPAIPRFDAVRPRSDELTVGQPVTIYDVPAIEAAGRNPIVPVIALDKQAADLVLSGAVGSGADLTPTDTLFTVNG